MAFMIGSLKPIIKPIYDILILRRIDHESSFQEKIWKNSYNKYLEFKYSYLDIDWFDYSLNDNFNFNNSSLIRLELSNKILSQGKIIVTDRLHASILSFLLGKPHIIINEKYKKIENTRNLAFKNIDECNSKIVKEYYANDPDEAIFKAVELLKNNFYQL